ncbi:MAG TPA: hypothetical protein V6D47_17040, partial [Oscillatoriaceae cyanobacterium]
MICENCGQRPASVHFAHSVNGRREDIQLCAQCAGQAGEAFGLNHMLASLFGGQRPRGRENMLQRLSEESQQVLSQAAALAVSWGYDQLGVEFLLMALTRQAPWGEALLREHKLTQSMLEQAIADALGRREPIQTEHVTLTSRL